MFQAQVILLSCHKCLHVHMEYIMPSTQYLCRFVSLYYCLLYQSTEKFLHSLVHQFNIPSSFQLPLSKFLPKSQFFFKANMKTGPKLGASAENHCGVWQFCSLIPTCLVARYSDTDSLTALFRHSGLEESQNLLNIKNVHMYSDVFPQTVPKQQGSCQCVSLSMVATDKDYS